MFFAIYYLLRTGCQWKALPRSLGAPSTVHDRFQEWVAAGVFKRLWESGLLEYHSSAGLHMTWQSIDACITKAPLGGESTGINPTDRRKSGTKRNLLTEGNGLPISVTVCGAHRHDKTQLDTVLKALPIWWPEPTDRYPQHLCADKGYDYEDIRKMIWQLGYRQHIKRRKQEQEAHRIQGYKPRQWKCERTHSWINRYRRLLIRWEKKHDNFLAFIHLACAHIVWRNCPVFG